MFSGRHRIIVALALLAGSMFVIPANASLVGDEIAGNGFFLVPYKATSYVPSPVHEIIGSDIEFTGVLGAITFDFGANTLTVATRAGYPIDGWIGWGNYSFSDFDVPITTFVLISNSGFEADFISDYGFSSNSIWLNMSNGNVQDPTLGGSAVFSINEVTVSATDVTGQVPEPGALGLVIAGLALLGAKIIPFKSPPQ